MEIVLHLVGIERMQWHGRVRHIFLCSPSKRALVHVNIHATVRRVSVSPLFTAGRKEIEHPRRCGRGIALHPHARWRESACIKEI